MPLRSHSSLTFLKLRAGGTDPPLLEVLDDNLDERGAFKIETNTDLGQALFMRRAGKATDTVDMLIGFE